MLVLLREQTRLPLAACTALAFLTALVVNFLLSRRTWGGRGSDGLGRHMGRFGALVAANLGFTVAVVTVASQLGVQYLLAKVIALTVSTMWTFVLYRVWVFA